MFRKKERKKKGNKPEFFADIPSCNNEKKKVLQKIEPNTKDKNQKSEKKRERKTKEEKDVEKQSRKKQPGNQEMSLCFSRRFIDRWKRMEVFPGCNKLVLSDSMDCIDWFLCLCITKHNKS